MLLPVGTRRRPICEKSKTSGVTFYPFAEIMLALPYERPHRATSGRCAAAKLDIVRGNYLMPESDPENEAARLRLMAAIQDRVAAARTANGLSSDDIQAYAQRLKTKTNLIEQGVPLSKLRQQG
jgi:hypothetical protein